MKSALRVLLLFTFRVSSVNHSLVLSVVSRFTKEAQLTHRNREHTVSWNRVKCCTNVRLIAFEKACNRWMTFKVTQGHCRCWHLITIYDFLLVFHCKYISVLHRFRDISTYLPKNKTSRDLDDAHLAAVCNHTTNTSRANPCTKFDDSIFSHSREI